jgi:hypothetical protein
MTDLGRLEAFYKRIDTDRGRAVVTVIRELRLARSIIHELAWGPVSITDRPRLRAALKAWGEADKVDL